MTFDGGRLRYISFLFLLIFCALLLVVRLSYLYIADPEHFPINTIKITASYEHISHDDIAHVLSKYENFSFFSFPVGQLYADLASFEWLDKIQIERVWPDSLSIRLLEKIPIATWNNAMMTEGGDLFNEGAVQDETLPHLTGPTNQYQDVLQVYKKMSKILLLCGLSVASLSLHDNQSWALILTNGIKLRLGKVELETRITRFCKAYPAVFAERSEQLASVDLRYPRGMAVRWKK